MKNFPLPLIAGGVAVILFILLSALYRVHQVEQALVVEFGKPVATVQKPGLHVKKPFIQDVVFFDKRLLEFNADSREVILGDQKRLIVDAYVRYRITDPLKFFQTVRDENVMRDRLNSIVESSLRQVLGNYPLDVVVSAKRADIMRDITAIVNSQTSGKPLPKKIIETLDEGVADKVEELAAPTVKGGFGVEVADVRIMRADLPQENSQATYRRMQTEREREAKEFRARGEEEAQKIRAQAENERTIILAKAQRESDIIRGEGDAKATKIFADAFNRDPQFYAFYRSLEAYRNVMNGKDTTMVLSPDSEFLRFMEKSPAAGQ